jgi:uncharacterized membrane protein
MGHVFFALFADRRQADAAVAEMHALDETGEHCKVAIHRGALDNEGLPVGETHGRARLVEGVLLSAIVGALLGGLVFKPLGLIEGDTLPWLIGALVGAALGGLGGLLTGVGGPDRRLERMSDALRRGGTIVTVDADGEFLEKEAERIVRAHGAHVEHHASI